MDITLYLWAGFGALCAVSAEGVFRHFHPLHYYQAWPGVLFGLGVNYSLFRALSCNDLLTTFIIFSSVTALSRLVVAFYLGEIHSLSMGTIGAYGLIVLANFIRVGLK